jgi:hypothetical protein
MSRVEVCFGGWCIEIEYDYNYEKGNSYGPMEDCYPSSYSFDYQLLEWWIDDEDDYILEEELIRLLGEEEVVFDLLVEDIDKDYEPDEYY